MNNVFFLSSYPPRHCGIATFTADVLDAVRPFCQHTGVIAMDDNFDPMDDSPYLYDQDVVYQIPEKNFGAYRRAAEWVNGQDVDLVHLQHEFSLFGGNYGNWVLTFLDELRKPCVATLHTVPLNPIDDLGHIVYEIGRKADRVIVMSPISVDILQRFYSVKASKISLIRHGSPAPYDRTQARHQLGIDDNHIIISTFGLIGPSKALEYAIEAIAKVVKHHPRVHFYILGQTHPKLIANNRDAYRKKLETLVSKLNITSHVHFINSFLDKEALCQWLAGSDIYVTPYLNQYQSCSGTLTYAVGFGKAIVSTPYLYAQDLLAEERGILVEFDTLDELHERLAAKISQLITDTDLRQTIEANAKSFGQRLQWQEIGRQHAMLYKSVLS